MRVIQTFKLRHQETLCVIEFECINCSKPKQAIVLEGLFEDGEDELWCLKCNQHAWLSAMTILALEDTEDFEKPLKQVSMRLVI